MAIREIITPENPILRKKAHKIANFKDKKLQELIDDMIETMEEAVGVGLAAPQVAVSQRLIVVMLPDDEASKEEFGEDAGVLYVVANPEIAKASKETVEGVEACLSIPGYFGTVERHEWISVKGQDRHGKSLRIKANGWLARVFQHEIDHLNGVLFIDLANRIWRAGERSEEEADGEAQQMSEAKTAGES